MVMERMEVKAVKKIQTCSQTRMEKAPSQTQRVKVKAKMVK